MVFVSVFSVAVLLPVVSFMERRFHWSRKLSSTVLVVGTFVVIGAVLLVVVQAISGAVRGFSHDLPHLVDKVRHSDVGNFVNGGSDSLDTLRKHASDITNGVGKASGGIVHVGASAFGAVTLALSVIFLTLFGLIEEPRVRDWTGNLLYRDKRERYLRVTDRIIQTTSRYMLGNLAISVVCGTVYGITAAILGLPYPLALAVIAGILDLIPNIGATTAGIIIAIVALSVSVQALIVFVIVIVVYQQIENYILQPTIIGKAAARLRLHRARQRPGVRSAVRVDRGDHRRADRGRDPDRRRGAHRRQKSPHRRRGRGASSSRSNGADHPRCSTCEKPSTATAAFGQRSTSAPNAHCGRTVSRDLADRAPRARSPAPLAKVGSRTRWERSVPPNECKPCTRQARLLGGRSGATAPDADIHRPAGRRPCGARRDQRGGARHRRYALGAPPLFTSPKVRPTRPLMCSPQ